MNSLFEKLRQIEKIISEEKGPFNLFAVFPTESKEKDRWDIVLSASWLDTENKTKEYSFLLPIFRNHLDNFEFEKISRIILLKKSDNFVKLVNLLISTEHSNIEFSNTSINQTFFEYGFIITSKK